MRLHALAIVFGAAACVTPSAATAPKPAADAAQPIARFGSRVITQADVEAKAGDDFAKLADELYELRTQTAERIALEAIVADSAKKEGVTEEQWLETRIETGLHAPTEDEMQTLFEKVKSKVPPGAGYDDVKPQLKAALQREARGNRARELFKEILKHAGYEVILAEPSHPKKEVDATGPSRGPAGARVTIVEFADFQCPYCSRAAHTVDGVLTAYSGQVRLVFRHFPLSFHEKAPLAAEAAACADEQGRFWAYHDVLFDHQDALEASDLQAHALTAGLDAAKFTACLSSGRAKKAVERDMEVGKRLGITGTPAFFINGTELSGAQPEEAFRKVIDRELEKKGR